MKIGLSIPSWDGGGSERMASVLANHWAEAGHEVMIFCWDSPSAAPVFSLAASVHHVSLDLTRKPSHALQGILINLKRVRVLRRAFQGYQPDLIVSFLERTNVTVMLALLGTGIPRVIEERTDPVAFPKERLWRGLRKLLYPLADGLVVQSKAAADFFRSIRAQKIHVIPDPVRKDGAVSSPVDHRHPCLLCFGRLESHKGHDVLLRAFDSLKDKFPEWTLYIYGEGPRAEMLRTDADARGLAGRVFFRPSVRVLRTYLSHSDIFVFPSSIEGLPAVLIEAQAAGIATVAMETMGGKEIIVSGHDGILVPVQDHVALAKALETVMSDERERKRLGENALQSAKRYEAPLILKKWDELLAVARS